MTLATFVETESMSELHEKFMRLLEVDQDSEEFERLFAEVDAELDAYVAYDVQESVA